MVSAGAISYWGDGRPSDSIALFMVRVPSLRPRTNSAPCGVRICLSQSKTRGFRGVWVRRCSVSEKCSGTGSLRWIKRPAFRTTKASPK